MTRVKDGESRPSEAKGPRIFVFGSNLAGRHGKGAALTARHQFGAEYGVGEGRTGRAYAIPTKDAKLQSRPLDEIQASVTRFLDYARSEPSLYFKVTAIGCGLAGYKPHQIAPMFRGAPDNCELPPEFIPFLVSAEARIGGTTADDVDAMRVIVEEAFPEAGDLAWSTAVNELIKLWDRRERDRHAAEEDKDPAPTGPDGKTAAESHCATCVRCQAYRKMADGEAQDWFARASKAAAERDLLRDLYEGEVATRKLLARWIRQNIQRALGSHRDHACSGCVPGGEMVVLGFRCAVCTAFDEESPSSRASQAEEDKDTDHG